MNVAASPNLPPASIIAKPECDDTISVFTTETNDSIDLLAFFKKRFPEIGERTKSPRVPRPARFFQETKMHIAKLLNWNQDKQFIDASTPDECDASQDTASDDQEAQEVCIEDDFYDDQDGSISNEDSISVSNIDAATEEQKPEDRRQDSKPSQTRRCRRQRGRLEVGFRQRIRHRRGVATSSVGKVFFRVKNRVVPPLKNNSTPINKLRAWFTNQTRKCHGSGVGGSSPPTRRQNRVIAKKLARTKQKLAAIQAELHHNKSLLERTMEERDRLQQQHGSQALRRENQVQEDLASQPAASSSVASTGGFLLRSCSPLRAFTVYINH